ncbi:MAG TPA: patatin-like phospholipase family protein [Bryobacteraceae bacterium]|nr:patatin-like phospholipase family protein [Bryobacteraceae bacterium]
MKALVLSPGGMFGAYQAGAWKILADLFQPDLIVGASIGAVNGWAIAGGCSPDELIERWREMECLRSYRWKFPAGLFGGVLGSENLRRLICDIHGCYPPRVDFALLLTELLKLRPRIFRGAEVTSEHLIAATALVGIFDQVRIDGTLYSDGGYLSVATLWAAAELGATEALVIDVLPEPPGMVARNFVRAMKLLAPFQPVVPPNLKVMRLTPPKLLGAPLDSIYWKRENVEQWIRAGETDAIAIKHSIQNCFERE